MDPTVKPPPTSVDSDGVQRCVPYSSPFTPAQVEPTQRQLDEAALRLAGTPDDPAAFTEVDTPEVGAGQSGDPQTAPDAAPELTP